MRRLSPRAIPLSTHYRQAGVARGGSGDDVGLGRWHQTGVAVRAQRDPVTAFFEELGAAGHIPTFERNSATLRFDVTGDGGKSDDAIAERWYVSVTNGDVTISHRDNQADAVIRIQRRYLAALVTGGLNAQAAYLRGLFTCEGSMAAVIMFQRCLPGPRGSKGRVAPISSATITAERSAT
jgi:SCP-2 sterol transfer family